MPQDGHAYTPAPTQPKDLEEALLEDTTDREPDSSPTQRRIRTTVSTHKRSDSAEIDNERGRGRSRDASRTSSRVRGGDDGLRTPRTASTTGMIPSRPLTPIIGTTSPLLAPIHVSPGPAFRSLGVHQGAEDMRRTRSSEGYGSTGSTVPSPVPRAQRLRDQDVSPLPGSVEGDDDYVPFPDPDITPRPVDVSRIPATAFPSRIDDRVRIQARRSLSSEEPRRTSGGLSGSREGAGEGNVVMLNDV